jgi:ABC-type nitrate/sulfonate/bicarbonate transport system permease component
MWEGHGAEREDRRVGHALDQGKVRFELPARGHWTAARILYTLAGILVVLIIWQATAMAVESFRGVSAFPRPVEVFEVLGDLLSGERLYDVTLYDHAFASLERFGIGFTVAALLGVASGAVALNDRVHEVAMVPLSVFQLIPGLAWVPVAMLMFGLGNPSTVFIIVMTAFPPIAIATVSGLRSVPKEMVRVGEMAGMGQWRSFVEIHLPAAATSVLTGLRVGLANGWRVLIAAEMVIYVPVGLGYSIYQSRWSLMYDEAFVCILVICLFGLVIEKLVFARLEEGMRNRLGLEG